MSIDFQLFLDFMVTVQLYFYCLSLRVQVLNSFIPHILKQKYMWGDFLYYIQENDKPSWLNKKFNIIKLEDNKIILPIESKENIEGKDEKEFKKIGENINDKKAQKLAQKTKKILDKTNSKKLVISRNIKQLSNYVNYLYSYNYEIVDGKWLFEVLSLKALDFIIEKKELKKEEIKVGILINDLTEHTLENIRIIVKEYKSVRIVTNHIEKLKKIEEQILEEDGIIIAVNNNKKKSLAKTDLILNIDFPSELINQYNINDEAIIVNIRGNVKINKKRFKGININDYEIKFEKNEDFDGIDLNKYKLAEIYEAKLYKKTPYKNIIDILNKDKVQILMIQGSNSKIF